MEEVVDASSLRHGIDVFERVPNIAVSWGDVHG
jgi:hypothetical protein